MRQKAFTAVCVFALRIVMTGFAMTLMWPALAHATFTNYSITLTETEGPTHTGSFKVDDEFPCVSCHTRIAVSSLYIEIDGTTFVNTEEPDFRFVGLIDASGDLVGIEMVDFPGEILAVDAFQGMPALDLTAVGFGGCPSACTPINSWSVRDIKGTTFGPNPPRGSYTIAATESGQVISNVGIVHPDQVVTFSEFTFPTATPIDTQFSSLGVTFSPGLCYDVRPFFFPTRSLASFGCSPSGNISIFFNNVVGAAAVALQSNPISSTFTALLDGAVIESFTTTTSLSFLPDLTHARDFYGFTGIQFNELRIANSEQVFQIDNLQFRSPPPKPKSMPWLMLLLDD